MLKSVLDVVTLRLSLYACAALLIISLGLGARLWFVTLQLDNAVSAKSALSAMLQLQNQAVDQWKANAAAQEQRAAAAEAQAVQVRKESLKRVKQVMSTPVPSKCPDAVQWAAIEAAKFAEEWEEKP